MASAPNDSITTLLARAHAGVEGAQDQLAAAVEPTLRRLAELQLRGRHDSMLESAALINEAWVRLCGKGVREFEGRGHFLRAATRTMRSILVDRARSRTAIKRGGGAAKLELTEDLAGEGGRFDELLALDDAIRRLPPGDAELAELRLFGGLTCREVAEIQGSVQRTVERRWAVVAEELRRRVGR